MWVLKLKIPYKPGIPLCELARKYNLTLLGYPLSVVETKKGVRLIISGYIEGDNFKVALKEARRYFCNVTAKDNFAIIELEPHKYVKNIFQAGVFFTRPCILNHNGEYIIEVASWKRLPLQLILSYAKIRKAEILSFRKKKLGNLQTIGIHPELTAKQRKCFKLAVENNYYDYPRGVTIKKLSEIAGISYSTFQFHLQNAEKKLFPYINSQV